MLLQLTHLKIYRKIPIFEFKILPKNTLLKNKSKSKSTIDGKLFISQPLTNLGLDKVESILPPAPKPQNPIFLLS